MPELTIYTDPNKLGQCEIPPFVIGDSTADWTLRFFDGNTEFAPSAVSMRIGHINGLTQAHASAFRLSDRAGNYGVYDIATAGGIFTLAQASGVNAPSLLGSNGVYLARGAKVARGIKSLYLASKGQNYVNPPRVVINGDGFGAAATATLSSTLASRITKVRNVTRNSPLEWVVPDVSGGGTGCELQKPQTELFTVTGATLSYVDLPLGSSGMVPIAFTGDVADGHVGAEGYVTLDASGELKSATITRVGVYKSNPGASITVSGTTYNCIILSGYSTFTSAAIQQGAGYTAPQATFTPRGSGLALGTPEMATWISGSVGRGITSIPVLNGGSGYNYVPRVSASAGLLSSRFPTRLRAIMDGDKVSRIEVLASDAYTDGTTPVITISEPGPQSFVVESAPQVAGQLRSITVTSGGSGYTQAPGVTIVSSSSPGYGAAARAILTGGVVTSIEIIDPGQLYSPANPPAVVFSSGAATATANVYDGGTVSALTITQPGAGYSNASVQLIADDGVGAGASAGAVVEVEANELFYKSDEVDQEVISGVRVTPHTDGRTSSTGELYFDNAMVILQPRVVAEAALSDATGVWAGTLDPVNNYVRAVLKLRRSLVLDLQVFGDGRMLLQGALVVLNKIQ